MFDIIEPGFHVLNFRSIIETASIIKAGKDFIEVPGVVIFCRSGNNIIMQFLNPGVDILTVSSDDFSEMEALVDRTCSKLNIDSKTKPKSTVFVNLQTLIENLVIFKESKDKMKINNIIFTKDISEFHGSSIAGIESYFVNDEQFELIYELIKARVTL